jgi:LDH2 family malate/lactate/ureidoglycolate dehydrogenase
MLNPTPQWKIVHETPGTATIDGDRGLGIMLGAEAMRLAIQKARDNGVGVVTLTNTGHIGAVGYFAMLAAQADMVGVCITCGGTLVVPTFGAEPRVGTNPISFAAPARNLPPLLYDAATSTIAGNKIGLALRVGANILPGWISEPDGTPIMDERPVPDRGHFHLLPLGSTREMGSHKGYGFALMAEVLAALLSGTLPSMLNPDEDSVVRFKSYFAAYNIAAFTDLDAFKDTLDRVLQTLLDTPPAPGHERVIYPGWSEHVEEQERIERGIPLHREVVEWFDRTTDELGIAALERMYG